MALTRADQSTTPRTTMTRIHAIPVPLPMPPLPVTGWPHKLIPRCPDWLRPDILNRPTRPPVGPISVPVPKPGTVFRPFTDAVKGAASPFPPGTRERIQKAFS